MSDNVKTIADLLDTASRLLSERDRLILSFFDDRLRAIERRMDAFEGKEPQQEPAKALPAAPMKDGAVKAALSDFPAALDEPLSGAELSGLLHAFFQRANAADARAQEPVSDAARDLLRAQMQRANIEPAAWGPLVVWLVGHPGPITTGEAMVLYKWTQHQRFKPQIDLLLKTMPRTNTAPAKTTQEG